MHRPLKMLDLFSGIGGFSLAAHWTGQIETVAFCEIEPFAQKVLRKNFPGVPIFEDVRTLNGGEIEPVDIICGGYPCQPFSLAGKRAGAEDDRHLWPEVHRLLQEKRPAWGLFENVTGHISMGLDNVLSDLEGCGYAGQAFIIPACAKDARHRRDRVWIVAHDASRDDRTCNTEQTQRQKPEFRKSTGRENVANPKGQRCDHGNDSKLQRPTTRKIHAPTGPDSIGRGLDTWRWESEPAVGRVAHGIPARVDRLRGLGNAIVPQVAFEIFSAMLAAHREWVAS